MYKFTKRLLLLALAMVPLVAMSQVMVSQLALETGTDATKWYILPDDETITQTLITNGGDSRASAVTPIGFNFVFGGESYSQFSVNTDGNLRLGDVATGTNGYSSPFGGNNLSRNLPKINGMGCDGKMGTGGYVKSALMGSAPNRVLVVEFKTAKYVSGDGNCDLMWQVQLFETSNEVQFVYGATAPTIAPSNFQIGMAASETDVVTVNTLTGTIVYDATSLTQSQWPAPSTYYRFYTPSCLRSSGLEVTVLTSSSVSFVWNRTAGQTEWQYLCVNNDATPDWSYAVSSNDTVGTINDLQPNSDYVIYLRTVCGNEEYSGAISLPFHTGCVAFDAPYIDNFDNIDGGSMPNCWTSCSGNSFVKSNTSYSTYAYSSPNSIKVGVSDIVVAPLIKLPANQISLMAQIRCEDSDAGSLEVGYVTDVSGSNFTSVALVQPPHTAYQQYIFDYTSLDVEDTVFVAFKQNIGANTYYNYYIDDVSIMRASSCPRINYAIVRNIGHDNATIAWDGNDQVASYEVAYSLNDDIENAIKLNVAVGTDSVVLSDLMSDSTYHVWVRNLCDSDSSMWFTIPPFKTKTACANVINVAVSSVDYNNAAICWSFDDSYGEVPTAVQLSYKKRIDSVWTTPVSLISNYYIIQGLESGYAYDVRLTTLCGSNLSDVVTLNFTTQSCGISIEGDKSSDAGDLPFGGNWNYAYSQMLYPATNLVGLDSISGVSFHIQSTKKVQDRLVDVYLANVSQSSLTLSTVIPFSQFSKVASNVPVSTEVGWVTIMFDSTFVYDGVSNLVVSIDDHTGDYEKTVYVYTNTIGNSLYLRSDYPIYQAGDSVVSGLSTMVGTPDIKFVTVCPTSVCQPPTIAFSEISQNAITLSWTTNSNVSQWVIDYKSVDSVNWISQTVSESSFTISNLAMGALYDIRVGALCGGDTLYAITQAITDCGYNDLPLIETFNDDLFPCWTFSSQPGYQGEARWKSSKIDFSNIEGACVITPALAPEASTLQVSFSLGSRSTYAGGALVISVGNDPNNYYSFVPIDTFYVAPNEDMTTQLLPLNGYTGNGHYIMFSSFTGKIYLDDINIDLIPACSMPTNLVASNITSDGATISWTDNGVTVVSWLVSYLKNGTTNPIVYEVLSDAGPTHTVTGLASNADYTVSVSTICENGDTTVTIYPISFHTACGVVSIPYCERFEGLPSEGYHACWYRDETVLVSNSDISTLDIKVPAVYVGAGADNAIALADNKAIISPWIPLPLNQLSLNFDVRFHSTTYSGDLVVGFTLNPNDYSNMIVLDTLSASNTEWNNYTINCNTATITDTGYIVFKNINNTLESSGWNDNSYFVWLDNIDFSIYSNCVRPSDVVVSNITESSAQIAFTDPSSTNDYTLAWSTTDNRADATTMDLTSTTTQLNNLLSGTTYYLWIRSNCSESEHSAWVSVQPFTTECAPVDLPYYENFDSYTYGVSSDLHIPMGYPNTMPTCWKTLGLNTHGSEPFALITTYQNYILNNQTFYIGSDNEDTLFAILPKFNAPTDSLMLTFTYRVENIHDDAEEFVLGVMTDPTDASTFMAVQSIPTYNTQPTIIDHAFAFDEVVLPNENYYIAFRCGGTTNFQKISIDDISVVYAPSCLHPIQLSCSNITTNSLNLSWVGQAANYQVQYRLADSVQWNAVVAHGSSVALSNLMTGSRYEMRVRALCGNSDTSVWSASVFATTFCTPMAVPWSENFNSYIVDVSDNSGRPDNYPHHAMPECWSFAPMNHAFAGGPAMWLTSASNNEWVDYNSIDGVTLQMVSNVSDPTYVCLPAMQPIMDSLVLTFDYAMAPNAGLLALGVMTDPHDFSTYQQLAIFPKYDSCHSAEHIFAYDGLSSDQTYYITFYATPSRSYQTLLDNIHVDYLTGCVHPAGLRVCAVMNNSAILKWHTVAANSEVIYRMVGETDWTSTIVNTDTLAITGLYATSDYQFAVRGICGNGDTSAWSDTITFTTECDPYSLPFSENFSTVSSVADLNCWSFLRGTLDDVNAGTATLNKLAPNNSKWKYKATGNITTPHLNINLYGGDCSDWILTPLISVEGNAVLSFRASFSDYGEPLPATDFEEDKFYVLVTPDNGDTWIELMTWGSEPTDDFTLDSLSIMGDSITIPLNQFAGRQIRIAFYGETLNYGGDNQIELTDIALVEGAPICSNPSNIEVSADAISAVLTWQGEGQDYETSIRISGSSDWNDTIAVLGLTYTFTNLTPQTNYEYRLRQSCGEELYSEWIGGTFTTDDLPCEVPQITLTSVQNDGVTLSWNEGSHHSSWEVNVFNAIINQTFDVDESRYTITGLEHATEYSVAVRAKCAESVYSDWSDTVTFTTLDCYPVTEVMASEVTNSTALISWTAGGDEMEWIVNYGERDFLQGEGFSSSAVETHYMLTGLEPATAYDVYVRAVCGDEFTSTWSTPVCQFTTLESEPEGIDGINGDFQFVIYPNPTNNATTISLNGVEGKVIISIVDMNGRMLTAETIECGSDCEKRIDVAHLAQGTYFVRVLGDNINSVRKLIIK